VQYQQEIFAHQLRYYKTKYHQAIDFINRNKREFSENKLLKKYILQLCLTKGSVLHDSFRKIQELTQENDQLRKHLGFTDTSNQGDRTTDGSSGLLNSSGKRRKIEQQR
jgi:hypothetical protein